MNISVRKGKRNDLKQIRDLVIELAIYEKEPDAVTASLADYEEVFDEGLIKTLVAEAEGKVIGMMLYYMTYSTWKGKMIHLEDFVVTKSHRQLGVGKKLFEAFLEEARLEKAILTRWEVLDWNEPALNFYKKIGATIEPEWLKCKLYL